MRELLPAASQNSEVQCAISWLLLPTSKNGERAGAPKGTARTENTTGAGSQARYLSGRGNFLTAENCQAAWKN
eukprot:CAMPEP_0195002796 /NCGR_PEP_ID=MMETSP0326_2-20130528/3020_1 /TAXON_ID=2866 ORGANISM="Crypthecodinium cohnii, Strain Seligo" /NCGR_SAMPLE_ID=MMETSP0326_2 /ASSEMBLY_ACC=CAM_ASM_000348 /LENGTH=72 /DNA_ID=CAMNT_0040006777 /DNA_START=219 /DNA_END=434 /DNA_ORIENTATION=+